MSLTVCLIARNEEANLPRALRSVAGVADEVVVVDTGSTDRTVDVAREAGARTGYFAWCDDFSAARNYAIEQAQCNWVLWLDADEELLESSHRELQLCLGREDVLAFLVTRQDLADASNLRLYTQMWQLRLFRRRPDLRFRGRCHPEFYPPIIETSQACNLQICTSSITLRHYGYLAEMRPAKLQRAARLLELELHDQPGQLYYQIEHGRTLLQLNDPRGNDILAEAAGQLVPRFGASEAPTPIVSALIEHLMQLPEDRLPVGYSRKRLDDLAIRWFPRSAPLIWWRAQQAFGRGQFAEAERCLRMLVQMGRDHSYDQHISFNPAIIGEDALLNLGVCLVRQAKLAEAEMCFQRLMKTPAHAQAAQQNLQEIARLKREAEKRKPSVVKRGRKRRR